MENSSHELSVEVSQTKKQLGQYFRVTLKYNGSLPLDSINLDSWRQHFEIIHDDEFNEKDMGGHTIQVLKLRLYPRTLKSTLLAPLKLGETLSHSVGLKVTQSMIKGSVIKLDWDISNISPWQREAVIIRIQMQSTDVSARVILDSPKNSNLLLRPLSTERKILKNGIIQFHSGWIYYPLKEGSLSLQLPAIRYQLSGSDRRRFYLPLQTINIKTLPGYLPPDLPIGNLKISSDIVNADPVNWKINVHTTALTPYGLPGLSRQLSNINDYDIANIRINYKNLSSFNDYGDVNIVHAPLPSWLMPFGQSIILKLRYFNPETGMLSEIHHTLPRHWNMPTWAWWVTFILCLLMSVFLIINIRPWILMQIRRYKLRQQTLQVMSADQLRNLILSDGHYPTLSHWSNNIPARISFAVKLNKHCFSIDDSIDLKKLRHEVLKLI